MKIILLSAGKGTRMMPLTRNTPKCLIQVGNGLSVLETQLEVIKRSSVKDVVIVLGYLAEQIETKIQKYKEDLNIKVVYNPFYDISNNLVSLWFARHEMNEDFLLINGDNLFSMELLERILNSDCKIGMVVSKKDEELYTDDDMKVIIQEGNVVKVGKHLEKSQTNAESIGMHLFKNGGNIIIKQKLDNMVRNKKNHDVFYLSAIQNLIDEGHSVKPIVVDYTHWAEIDFHPDLKLIENNINKFHAFL